MHYDLLTAKHWNMQKGSKVGVIGLGGLGYMAVKLAVAMEKDVTLFTRLQCKSDESLRLGASWVVLSTDKTQMKVPYRQLKIHSSLQLLRISLGLSKEYPYPTQVVVSLEACHALHPKTVAVVGK